MNVSVVIPVYNAEDTILQALDSVRNQTFQNMEIIVINDGSTDRTLELLRKREDIILLNCAHRGIVPALNDGLAAARGTYIARMDADDLCHPRRIEQQVDYLETFPEVGIVGSRVKFGGNRKKQAGYSAYVDWINTLIEPTDIELNRFVESPFAHPSILFRRELLEHYGTYRDGPFPEDYELWLRWMSHGVKAGKVDKELVTWNDPPTRLSRTDTRYSIEAFYKTKANYLLQWLEQHNPRHPDVIIWGAGRVTRKRAEILSEKGLNITQYIDIKARTLESGIPVIHHTDLPDPRTCFVLSMVGNHGARSNIRAFLKKRGFSEGHNCIFAA